MTRLRTGDVVCTSYGSGPYRIIAIERDCTCPDYQAVLEVGEEEAPRSAPHMHLTCVETSTPLRDRYRQRELRWLAGFVETNDGRIFNVWRNEELHVENEPTRSGQFYAGLMPPVVCRTEGASQ